VKILDILRKQNWRNNIVEMKVQTVENVIPIFLAPPPSLLHHNNVGVTCPITSNLKMEPIRFVSLYFVAIP
jgi:hypothetical protein